MKTLNIIFGLVLGFVLFGSSEESYRGFSFVLDRFGTLAPHVATLTAIASAVAVLCAAIIAHGFKWTGRTEETFELREEKADLYEGIVLAWGEKLKHRLKPIDQTVEEELQKLERLLILRGDSKIIKTYVEFQTLEKDIGLHMPETLSHLAKIFLEMRKDLGLSVLNLNESDIIDVLKVEVLRDIPVSMALIGRPQVSLSQGQEVASEMGGTFGER